MHDEEDTHDNDQDVAREDSIEVGAADAADNAAGSGNTAGTNAVHADTATEDDDRDDDELTWAEKEEKYGRAWVEAELDPYDPDPELQQHLNETDNSLDNEDLGLDDYGNREDD